MAHYKHEHRSLPQIFVAFLRVGLMSLGGGASGWIHREIVTRLGWIGDDDFLAGVAVAQVLPGVNTTNLAVYVGHKLRGLEGAAAALSGFLFGPFCIAIVVAIYYRRLLALPGIDDAMIGVAAVALGMIARVGLLSARRSRGSIVQLAVMAAAFVSVGLLRWPLIPVVLVLTPISVAAARMSQRRRHG